MEQKNQNVIPESEIKIPLPNESDIQHLKTKSELDQEFLEQFELNPEIIDEPIQYTFEIDGIRFSPLGDIQALKGAQKNGKSFFLCLLMGAAMKGQHLNVRCLIENPRILYADTEQHPRNTRMMFRRVCQIAGIDGYVRNERINMQHLRLADDVEIVKKAIRLKIEHFKPHIVLVDGLVDCLVDFNDQKESKKVLTEFARIALENNCCIWLVLHTNPGDSDKMRGHAGTLLSQKASDVVVCIKEKKDDGTTLFNVEQTDNRNNQDFNKFSFAIECRKDSRGEFISVPVKAYVSVQEKTSLDELFRWALKDNPMRRADLKDKIISDDCPLKVKRSTAYQRINDALALGVIADDDVLTKRLRYIGLDLPNEDGLPF